MKYLVLTGAAAALIAGAALAQAPTSKARVGRDAGDAAAAPVGMLSASTLGSMDAKGFVENAARSDMYEIKASKLALEKTQDPEIKTFAREMIRDHMKTTQAVKAHLPPGITPPAELDKRRQGLLDDLRASSGPEFDKRYINQQVAAHEEALTLMKGYAAHGDKSGLKMAAAKAVPIVTHHLEMIKAMAKTH